MPGGVNEGTVPVFSFMGHAAMHPQPGALLDYPHQRADARDHPQRL